MLILLDCRPLQKAGTFDETTWFIITCVKELAARQGVEWIFLLNKNGGELALPANGRRLVRRALPGRLGEKLWYRWLIPRMAKRERVDMVMTGGMSLKRPEAQGDWTIKIPACIWKLADEGLIFSVNGKDVRVPLAPDEEVRLLSADEREKLKGEAAGGREYFFVDATGMGTTKVMNLLKAFSLFKKRQLSNMKLVLAGVETIEKLDSYKYREDVCLYPGRAKGLMEAAYAVIHMPRRNDMGIAILNSWRANVPVIMVGSGSDLSVGGRPEGFLRVSENDIGSLAEALKSLYKNEGIRNELIENGAGKVAGLSVQGSATVIGELLGKTN